MNVSFSEIIIYYYLSLFITIYHYLSLYITIYLYLSLFISIYLSSYLSIYLFTSLRDGNRPHRIVVQPLVTANDVGHWDQKHPKVLIVGKKNAKNLIAMYSGPTQFKK